MVEKLFFLSCYLKKILCIYFRAETKISHDDDTLSISTSVDGDSYQLIITKGIDCNVDQVTNFIQEYVPDIILLDDTEMQIIFNLPAIKRNQFATLFSALEFQKENFHMENVKITNSTSGDIYPR